MSENTRTEASEPLQVYILKTGDAFTTSSAPLSEAFSPHGKPCFARINHYSDKSLVDFLGTLPNGSGISCTHDVMDALPREYQEALAGMGVQAYGTQE